MTFRKKWLLFHFGCQTPMKLSLVVNSPRNTQGIDFGKWRSRLGLNCRGALDDRLMNMGFLVLAMKGC